jgi:hypothetical protein
LSVFSPFGASPFWLDVDMRRSLGFRFVRVEPVGDGTGGARGTSNDPRPENVCPLARRPKTPEIPVDVFGRGSRVLLGGLLLLGEVGFDGAVPRIRSDNTCGLFKTDE